MTKQHTTENIYTKLTTGMFFSPERNRTKQAIENVLNTIGPRLDLKDMEILGNLDLCAPAQGQLCQTMPVTGRPVVYLSPEIEEVEIEDAIELAVANSLARGIQLIHGLDPKEFEQRSLETVHSWGYKTGQPQRAGAAA